MDLRVDPQPRFDPRRRPRPTPFRAALAIVIGFVTLIAVGTLVLVTPLASEAGDWTPPVDALFTSVSAVTDTGLIVVDTADHWSFLGELTITVLAALGGLGIMASATLAVLLGRRTSLTSRAAVLDAFGGSLGNVRGVVRGAVAFALIGQAIGILVLFLVFLLSGVGRSPADTLWQAVFTVVSAFNNAGFDLAAGPRGFGAYSTQPVILLTVGALIVVGGLGFVIAGDVYARRAWRPLAVETKLVLIATALFIVGGAVAIAVVEWGNPRTLGPYDLVDKAVNATFASVTTRSAGFSALDMRGFKAESDGIMTMLMFVGTASGSTGGGIKVNTVAVLVLVVLATAQRRSEPEAFGRRIAVDTIARAVTVVVVSVAAVFIGSFIVAATGGFRGGAAIFETVSAFGTVGLSIAGPPRHQDATSLALALLMFLGRVGPIALVILLFGRSERSDPIRLPEQTVRVG
jgi:trk system potassium uptake protein TrkH